MSSFNKIFNILVGNITKHDRRFPLIEEGPGCDRNRQPN